MPIQTLLRKPINLEDIEVILELLDRPALVYNQDKGVVEVCNSAFIRLSEYSRKEVIDKPVIDLFPDFYPGKFPEEQTTTIIQLSNSSTIEIETELHSLQVDAKYRVITLEEHPISHEVTNPINHSANWEALDVLLQAPLSSSLKTAFQDTFRAAQNLTGCDHLAVYLPIPGSKNKLIMIDSLGEIGFLPKIVHVAEIDHLSIPVIWQLGSHSTSILHQSALAAHITYLASTPLVPETPDSGLLVLGNSNSSPPLHLAPILKIISRTVSVCLNFHEVVTESKKELKETNYQLEIVRNIRNQISEGLIFIDTDYTIIDLNTSSSHILGYTEADMLGQPLEKILICDGGLTDILREIEKKTVLVHDLGELQVARRDGKTIPTLMRAIPLISENGPNATAILFTDLSTLKQYEDRSRQLESQANIGEMIAVFAHEVRNPINNIRMGVENFITYIEDDHEAGDEIDRILSDVDRLSDLMKSILTAYRTKEYKMEPIHLPGFIESILFRWKPRMDRYGVTSRLEILENDEIIFGDKRALEQVFTNIIQNAMDAMRKEGGKLVIRISDEPQSEGIRVDIADTGPGIPTDIQEKIFNLYYTTRQDGNGIGLAITKQIIDAHNGQIAVTSVPGGTVFRVILPKGKK